MILIISRDSDTTTDLVMEWLSHWGLPFLRLNEDLYEDVFVDYIQNIVRIKDVDTKDIKVVWFRKFPNILMDEERDVIQKQIYKSVINFRIREGISFREYLFQNLDDNNVKWLTNPFFANENKLLQMKAAQRNGLNIPETYILTSKKEIINLLKNKQEYITKPFENCMHLMFRGKSIGMKTTVINSYIKDIPNEFPPSLIQKRIDKKYELRIFFLMGKFFTAKICDEDLSEVDHRINMIYLKGRFENFNLPTEIEYKLCKVLQEIGLNCASIDMIIDSNDEYFFLEINPTGQFTYHSYYNNTYLEKEVALALKQLYETA
ncbi:hypothetical protein [Epilithonimonas hominis]|uniref:ATP-grasp domain-containing protein n=2 Tax=Epilithonimonas TaxID=2782229 RepID=A0A3N0XA29_9FLAO|nr:hypothetical protein [Epilithonimonas hominis]ROI14173.1 hypothetical protein EGH73_05390 [Epilithonimonas hominis]HAP96199.1 hypothetical protein [Chryseobacterium sp.]